MIFLVVSAAKQNLVSEEKSGFARRASQPIQFALGYFGIWSLVGVAAYLGLTFLFRFYPLFSSLGQFVGVAAGAAVFLAGAYQLSPLKQKALEACRSPMHFVMTKWRGGRVGGFMMGLDYGLFCTKCCWAYMTVLVFVGGMNLLWMVMFAGAIFVEKIVPPGVVISKGLGVLLMVAGVALALSPV
jgi:predicted metal-binding membrane protein